MLKISRLLVFAVVGLLLVGCAQNQAPIIRLKTEPNPAVGEAPLRVVLDATKTIDPEGDIMRFYWFWKEGGRRITVGGPKIIHNFKENTEVVLMVMDERRNIATKRISIVVLVRSSQLTSKGQK